MTPTKTLEMPTTESKNKKNQPHPNRFPGGLNLFWICY